MISSVRGTVLSSLGGLAVIEVGGMGFAVQVTPRQALTLRVGSEARLHTVLIVREDDLSLFGFGSVDELAVFDHLRSVTGVGPKSALGVLAVLTPAEVARAVAMEDDAAFRKVSGIGPKTAKLIVVSLAGKLQGIMASPHHESSPDTAASVIAALLGLGWNERLAAEAVDSALRDAGEGERENVQAILRRALAELGPQRTTGGAA